MVTDLPDLGLQALQILEGLRLFPGVAEQSGGVVQRHHLNAVLLKELPMLLRDLEVLADQLHGADAAEAHDDVAQLTGKNIGVQNGTSHQSYLLEQLKDKEVKAVPYASYQNALMDLTSGRVDAVFADTAVAAEWLKSHNGYQMVGKPVTDAKYFGAGFAIAVNKGNKALLDSLNQGLAAIKANGTYQKLYAKYFSK